MVMDPVQSADRFEISENPKSWIFRDRLQVGACSGERCGRVGQERKYPMEIKQWNPRREYTKEEEWLLKRVRRHRKLFAFLREHRQEIFDKGFEAELVLRQDDSDMPRVTRRFAREGATRELAVASDRGATHPPERLGERRWQNHPVAGLAAMYRETGAGKEPVTPALMAMAVLLQEYAGVSAAEAVELSRRAKINERSRRRSIPAGDVARRAHSGLCALLAPRQPYASAQISVISAHLFLRDS
jgi:hypothetical protein